MSEVVKLRSGPDLGSGFLQFPDLKNRLERDLGMVQTLPDLEALINSVNELMKRQGVSLEEKNFLKRMRQRAYDRRRNFKPTIFETIKPQEEAPPMLDAIREPVSTNVQAIVPAQLPTFSANEVIEKPGMKIWQGVQKGIGKIDGEKLIEGLPWFLALAVATIGASALVWIQSVELYKASGFDQPQLAAIGAIAMILGFAAIHASSRSIFTLLLCFYATGYESYFMISGTVQNENASLVARVETDHELVLLAEKAERARAAYLTVKARFDDPTTEVHNNDWFKKKHLDPAWELHEKAQSAVVERRNALTHAQTSDHVTWLKIMYRLGLVFLCMVIVHKFLSSLLRK